MAGINNMVTSCYLWIGKDVLKMNIKKSFKSLTITIVSSFLLLSACGEDKKPPTAKVGEAAISNYKWNVKAGVPRSPQRCPPRTPARPLNTI